MTTFLRFPDEATAQQVMADYYQPYVAAADGYYDDEEGENPVFIPPVAEQEAHWKTSGYWWGLDVVGVITRPVGEPDEEGNQATETLDGWHLNFNGDLPEQALEYVVEPKNPVRTFA
jgi:hypothetical protein